MVILYKLGHYWVLFIELLTDVHAELSMLYDQLEATAETMWKIVYYPKVHSLGVLRLCYETGSD